ncbi:Peptidase S10, serine carboxypeptidase, partial [Dillenia turbinata]
MFRDISVSHILEPVCKVISPKAMQQAGARGRRSLDEELTVDLDSLLQQVPAFWCRVSPSPTMCLFSSLLFVLLNFHLGRYGLHQGYGYALAGLWANNEQVRQALGVRPGTKEYWKRCNESLSYTENVASSVCYHKNLTNTRLRALIYSGDHDMSVPSLATRTWIQSLNMTVSIPWRAWYVDAQVGGYMEIYTNNDFEMAFATGGGHTAPEYRPKEVFELLRR